MIPLKDENPVRTVPVFTVLIILVNIAVFAYQAYLGALADGFVKAYAVTPAHLTALFTLQPDAHVSALISPVTAMFLHGGFLHLAGNMLFLWIFGNNIEDAAGHLPFVLFYLVCGLAAAVLHVTLVPGSPVPMIGASGAVSGVMGAYLLRYPRARILTMVVLVVFIRFIRIPAWFFLVIWFLLQLAGSYAELGTPGQSGVAFAAHVGGFLAGMVLGPFFTRGRRTVRRRRT